MIETVRLSGGDITDSLCDDLRCLWVESLVHVKPDISASEIRRLYQSEQLTPEVLRRQADLAEGGIYVALADASIKAAASVGRTDALGLASDIPDVQDNNLIYLERYGARNMKRWDLFRGLVNAVLNHETGPNNRPTYLGMYIDERALLLPGHVKDINPQNHQVSRIVKRDSVGGVAGNYRLHTAQLQTDGSWEWLATITDGERAARLLGEVCLRLELAAA